MAIRPPISKCSSAASGASTRRSAARSSAAKPCLDSSAPRLTSIRPAEAPALPGGLLGRARRRSRAGRPHARTRKSATALRTLFDCSGPSRCHSTSGGRSGALATASCTRFSPKQAQAAGVGGGERRERLLLARADQPDALAPAAGAVAGGLDPALDLEVAVGGGRRRPRLRALACLPSSWDSGVVFDAQKALAAFALDDRPAGADLDRHLGPDLVVAARAVPDRLRARPFDPPDAPPACRPCSARRSGAGARGSGAAARPRAPRPRP